MHIHFETDPAQPAPAPGGWLTMLFWVGGSFVAAGVVTLLTTVLPIAQMGYAATHLSVQARVVDVTQIPDGPFHPAHTETVLVYTPPATSSPCRSVVETPRKTAPVLHPDEVVAVVPRGADCDAPPPIIMLYIAPVRTAMLVSLALVAIGAVPLALWWWMGAPQIRPPRRRQFGVGVDAG